MKAKKIIAIFAMLIGIATTAVFIGCKKEENKVVTSEQKGIKYHKDVYAEMYYLLRTCKLVENNIWYNGIECVQVTSPTRVWPCSAPFPCTKLPDWAQPPMSQQQQLLEIHDQLSMIHDQFLMMEDGPSVTNDQLFEIFEQMSNIYDQLSMVCFNLPMSPEQNLMIREHLVMAYELLGMRKEQIRVLYASGILYELTEFYDQMKIAYNQLEMAYEQLSMIDEQPIYDNIISQEEAHMLLEEINEQYGGFRNTKPFIRKYWNLCEYLFKINVLPQTPDELYELAEDNDELF